MTNQASSRPSVCEKVVEELAKELELAANVTVKGRKPYVRRNGPEWYIADKDKPSTGECRYFRKDGEWCICCGREGHFPSEQAAIDHCLSHRDQPARGGAETGGEQDDLETMTKVANFLQSQLDGVTGALADAGDVLANRVDGDYGASVRQVVEQRDALRKKLDCWQETFGADDLANALSLLKAEQDLKLNKLAAAEKERDAGKVREDAITWKLGEALSCLKAVDDALGNRWSPLNRAEAVKALCESHDRLAAERAAAEKFKTSAPSETEAAFSDNQPESGGCPVDKPTCYGANGLDGLPANAVSLGVPEQGERGKRLAEIKAILSWEDQQEQTLDVGTRIDQVRIAMANLCTFVGELIEGK